MELTSKTITKKTLVSYSNGGAGEFDEIQIMTQKPLKQFSPTKTTNGTIINGRGIRLGRINTTG